MFWSHKHISSAYLHPIPLKPLTDRNAILTIFICIVIGYTSQKTQDVSKMFYSRFEMILYLKYVFQRFLKRCGETFCKRFAKNVLKMFSWFNIYIWSFAKIFNTRFTNVMIKHVFSETLYKR